MSWDETNEWRDSFSDFVRFYSEVNELVIAAERIHPEHKLSLSAIIELRAALSHLMRIHAAQLGITPEDEIKNDTGYDVATYCMSNLDKGKGHLFRAGYDAYDAIALSLELDISRTLEAFSHQTIYGVVHTAALDIFERRKKALSLISQAKAKKDVEGPGMDHLRYQQLDQATMWLTDVRDLLARHRSQFADFEAEHRDSSRREKAFHVVLGVILGIIFCLLSIGIEQHVRNSKDRPPTVPSNNQPKRPSTPQR